MKKAILLLALGVLLGCPKPTPTPTPTPPPPDCACEAPAAQLPGWIGVTVDTPYAEAFIVKARDAVGNRCGTDGNETLALVADAMKAQNVCAVGPWADALLVARPDGIWEEWHVIEWSNTKVMTQAEIKVEAGKVTVTLEAGCWYPLSKAFKGAWSSQFAKAPKKGCK